MEKRTFKKGDKFKLLGHYMQVRQVREKGNVTVRGYNCFPSTTYMVLSPDDLDTLLGWEEFSNSRPEEPYAELPEKVLTELQSNLYNLASRLRVIHETWLLAGEVGERDKEVQEANRLMKVLNDLDVWEGWEPVREKSKPEESDAAGDFLLGVQGTLELLKTTTKYLERDVAEYVKERRDNSVE